MQSAGRSALIKVNCRPDRLESFRQLLNQFIDQSNLSLLGLQITGDRYPIPLAGLEQQIYFRYGQVQFDQCRSIGGGINRLGAVFTHVVNSNDTQWKFIPFNGVE